MKCNDCLLISEDTNLFCKDNSRISGYKNRCKKCSSDRGKKFRMNNRFLYKNRYDKEKESGIIEKRIKNNPIRYRAHEIRHGMVNRSRIFGIEFDNAYFTTKYIQKIIVDKEKCPCCGIKFEYSCNGKKNLRTPSCDRFDNSKGYIRGNVYFICWRCNLLKSDGTIKDFELLIAWLKQKLSNMT